MTGIVAEDRAYNLQRQLETHAKKNLELQENSESDAHPIDVDALRLQRADGLGLPRLTGNSWTGNSWTVMNTEWANS